MDRHQEGSGNHRKCDCTAEHQEEKQCAFGDSISDKAEDLEDANEDSNR